MASDCQAVLSSSGAATNLIPQLTAIKVPEHFAATRTRFRIKAPSLVRLLASNLDARRSATDVISWDRNVMSPITENITPSTRTPLALTF